MLRLLKTRLWDRILPALAVAAAFAALVSIVAAETVDPNGDNSQFAYAENVGWINAEPSGNAGPGVTVSGTKLTGYMYGENIGWINLNCTNNATCAATGDYGVTNNGLGVLGGYAWGENVGWVSFSCANDNSCAAADYGVTIDRSTGVFSGYAWGENIGWISFSDTAPFPYRVQTADDSDGVAGATDNCPFDDDVSQANTDSGPAPPAGDSGQIDNGPGIATDDTTVPDGDKTGDACDTDRDNDGLPDAHDTEPLGATGICAAFSGSSGGHPNPEAGDNTNDDNANGDPAAPMGGDAADNGPSWDTDNDAVPDGYECLRGANPRSAASKPAALGTDNNDDDTDGLTNGMEARWGTDPNVVDTDADSNGGDCREAADLDGNGVANFPGDTLAVAKAALLPAFGKTQDFDFDKNGVVNFPGDTVNHAKRTLSVVPCP